MPEKPAAPSSERPDIDRLADTVREGMEDCNEDCEHCVALDELVALALEREMLRGQIATVKRHMNGRCDHLAERSEAAEARVAELEAALREAGPLVGLRLGDPGWTPERAGKRIRAALAVAGGSGC